MKNKLERPLIGLERAYTIIRSPLVTEKAVTQSQHRQYGFLAASEASKPEIKSAVEQIFKVKVQSVNTIVQKGKAKVFRGRRGTRSDYKKAFVTLAVGQTLDVSAEV